MIDTRPLKNESSKFQEPLRSVIEMQRDTMPEIDFINLFMTLRKKAREIDTKQKEAGKT